MAGLAFSRCAYRNTAGFGELIDKGQVLSSHEKCPSQLDEHFASFRILLHSWAPFYVALSARRAITLHWCWPGFTTHAHASLPMNVPCTMIWWKTWAGTPSRWALIKFRSSWRLWQTRHVLGERGAAGLNGSRDRMKKRKVRWESYRMIMGWYWRMRKVINCEGISKGCSLHTDGLWLCTVWIELQIQPRKHEW